MFYSSFMIVDYPYLNPLSQTTRFIASTQMIFQSSKNNLKEKLKRNYIKIDGFADVVIT